MKVSKILFNLLKYYLIGNLLFNTIFTITEVVFANILSLHITFFDIFVKNIYYNLYLYTVLYFIYIIPKIAEVIPVIIICFNLFNFFNCGII